MAANLGLVPAPAGKRLGAAVLDWLAPVAVLVVTFAVGFAGITRTQSGGFIIYDTSSLVLFGCIGMGLTLVFGVNSGRNPITLDGIQGPYSFAPLDRNVLVGRNLVGQPGEQQAQLLAVTDPGRSISKTHLHLLTDGAGIWVTDRNSNNGSAVTTPDGRGTHLQPGVPAFVSPGSTVHFGDRSFHLGQA